MCYSCNRCNRCGKFTEDGLFHLPDPPIICLECGSPVDPVTAMCPNCKKPAFSKPGDPCGASRFVPSTQRFDRPSKELMADIPHSAPTPRSKISGDSA